MESGSANARPEPTILRLRHDPLCFVPKSLAKDMTVSSTGKAAYLLLAANEDGPLNLDEVCGPTLSVEQVKAGLRELADAGYTIIAGERVVTLLSDPQRVLIRRHPPQGRSATAQDAQAGDGKGPQL